MLALPVVANAEAPLCVLTAAYCDYPLKPDERAVFQVIVRYAGWDGGWCERSAGQFVAESLLASVRGFSYVATLLVRAKLIEKQEVSGRPTKFRPLPFQRWLDPAGLTVLRSEVYPTGRNKKQAELPFHHKNVLPFPATAMRHPHPPHATEPSAPFDPVTPGQDDSENADPLQHPTVVRTNELLTKGMGSPLAVPIFAAEAIIKAVGSDPVAVDLWEQLIDEYFMRLTEGATRRPNPQIFLKEFARRIEKHRSNHERNASAARAALATTARTVTANHRDADAHTVPAKRYGNIG